VAVEQKNTKELIRPRLSETQSLSPSRSPTARLRFTTSSRSSRHAADQESTTGTATSPQPARFTTPVVFTYLLPLLCVGLLGVIHLSRPFHGDQALFMLGAQALRDGKTLYVDFWDFKQPGIFFFYFVAGKLFGFSESGVHFLELIYLLSFCAVLIKTLRPVFSHPWLASFVPLATIGAYYSVVDLWHLTQLEILTAFPLYLSLWLVSSPRIPEPHRAQAFFLSGCAAGVVVVFKLILAPIPAAFWVVAILTALYVEDEQPSTLLWERLFPAVCGVAAVLTLLVCWSWLQGSLSAFLWTCFGFPLEAATTVQHNEWRLLAESMFWFGTHFMTWISLAGIALIAWWNGKPNLMVSQMIAWLCMGLFVILLQKLSWWPYHFLLLIAPVGILALHGVDEILTKLERRRQPSSHALRNRLRPSLSEDTNHEKEMNARRKREKIARAFAVGAILLALVPGLWVWGRQAARLAAEAFNSDEAWVRRYQQQISTTYRDIWQETRFLLDTEALPGPLYVFGNPLYLFLSGREQAIPLQGWSWELNPPSLWDTLAQQLATALPVYIFVDHVYADLIATQSPQTKALLDTAYTPVETTAHGVWYRRKTVGQ
jgi:hypothetical protein